MKWWVVVFFLLTVSSGSFGANELQGMETGFEGDQFTVTYKFKAPVDPGTVNLDVQGQSLVVMIPEGQMPSDKNLVKVNLKNIGEIETSIGDLGQISSKIAFATPLNIEPTQDAVRIEGDGANLRVSFSTTATAEQKAQAESLKESEIPVLATAAEKKVANKNPYTRMIFSLAVIGLLAGGLIYFSKWYARNHKSSSENNKIRVLTQHHLGPRKTLAIVRVAGESMLIGITDHNISMLKSLSLIDDEFAEITNENFQTKLAQSDKKSEAANPTYSETGADEFIVNSIKDKISTKLKGMRPI